MSTSQSRIFMEVMKGVLAQDWVTAVTVDPLNSSKVIMVHHGDFCGGLLCSVGVATGNW